MFRLWHECEYYEMKFIWNENIYMDFAVFLSLKWKKKIWFLYAVKCEYDNGKWVNETCEMCKMHKHMRNRMKFVENI